MDDFKRMAVFATVVQHSSMSAAGRALGMSASAVSQQVRLLEREAGVTLMHRTTRQLTLTDAGQRFYAHCAQMLEAAERARSEISAERLSPNGELRVSLPVGFVPHIAPALGPLLHAYPSLRLLLQVDDAQIDLTSARIDLALRFGRLPDSHWVARRLGTMQWWLCASPAWEERHGAPATLDALLTASWLGLPASVLRDGLTVRTPAMDDDHHWQEHQLPVQPRIASNNQNALMQMCEAGLGLALLGSMDAHDAVASGRLVRLLPQWEFGPADGLPIWAVTPHRDMQPAKVRMALERLHNYLGTVPGVFRKA